MNRTNAVKAPSKQKAMISDHFISLMIAKNGVCHQVHGSIRACAAIIRRTSASLALVLLAERVPYDVR